MFVTLMLVIVYAAVLTSCGVLGVVTASIDSRLSHAVSLASWAFILALAWFAPHLL